MTLSKRATLLILPVLLLGYLAMAAVVYWVERSSIERREQARLDANLMELHTTFSAYDGFADSYLFAITESELLPRYIAERDDRYRGQALGLRFEAALGRLLHRRADYLSFVVLDSGSTPLFHYASSDDPFRQISPEELNFAHQTLAQKQLSASRVVWPSAGAGLLIRNVVLDRRTLYKPLPSQLTHSLVLQVAVEMSDFNQQLAQLQQRYQAEVSFLPAAAAPRPGLFGEIQLMPDLYLSIQPSAAVVEPMLLAMRRGLIIVALLLGIAAALIQVWLIRRHITRPIEALDLQLTELMQNRRTQIDPGAGDTEVGRLAFRFRQLHSQLSDAYRRSRQLAEQDGLTGLPNRNHFYDLAVRELKQAQQHQHRVALLYIDLDHFKFVNDKYGHSVGDALLRSFAHRARALLQQEMERTPRAGKILLARLAGDEFAVLISRHAENACAETVAGMLLSLVENGYRFEMGTYPVTASIGIAQCPQDGHTITQLISNADTAMYQAKHDGKNRYAFYSLELAQSARRQVEIEHQLKALDCDREFYLTYMPILDADSRVVGCEALLRWQSPVLGAVGPDQFIPIAERAGLYSRIDRWVIQRAAAEFAELKRILGEQLLLSINISSAELTVPDFDLYIAQTLQQADVPCTNVEIEMTETFSVEESQQRDHLLRQLRALGVQIAIDDFGTGYTSMMQMLQYPVDKIKLDRSFVERLVDPGNRPLLAPIISLCHARGLKVTAEGVETEVQRQILLDARCDLLQGYLFGKPMRLDELAHWYRTHGSAMAGR